MAAAQGRLLIYLDRFATNEPVAGASLDVIENDQPTRAVEATAGIYAIAGWTRPPGMYSFMIAIDADGVSDLLPVTIEIHEPVAPMSGGGPQAVWIVVGQTSAVAVVALIFLLFYVRARRQYDYLLESGARFSDSALLLSAARPQAIEAVRCRRIGPSLIADRLWEETGCRQAIAEAAVSRRFNFPVERVVYASVLQRMFATEPRHSVSEWLEDHAVPGTASLNDRQVNVAMAWLGKEFDGTGTKAPRVERTTKDLIEERLFAQRADADAGLDLVFFNTLPITLETRAEAGGRAKARRSAAQQMAVGVVIDADRRPICFELWPGGALDVEALIPTIDRLRARFDIRRVCIVADLRIAKPETIEDLETRGIHFILGVRESDGDLRTLALADTQPLEPVRVPRPRGGYAEFGVKEVVVGGSSDGPARERFIVCSSPKAEAAAAERPGHYVLRTNTKLPPAEVVQRYRQLLMVEETFGDAKAILDTQAVPRARHAIVRGHMFCSFLALLLRRELEERLARAGVSITWQEIVRDLWRLAEVEVVHTDRRFVLRTRPEGSAAAVIDAVGVPLPPPIERRTDWAGATLDATAVGDAPWADRMRREAVRLVELAVARAERDVKLLGNWVGRYK
ncbi:MAG: transposase [Proteobacteria bacterium]|nr:transposase [Pseudomonadota bacterium]